MVIVIIIETILSRIVPLSLTSLKQIQYQIALVSTSVLCLKLLHYLYVTPNSDWTKGHVLWIKALGADSS